MVRRKTSRSAAISLRNTRRKKRKFNVKSMTPIKLKTKKGIAHFDPDKILSNKDLIIQAIFEGFMQNDPDAILEIINAYTSKVNKSEFSENSGIARSTLYDMLEGRKNPTLRVLTQCIHEILC